MNPAAYDLSGDNQVYRGDTWQFGGIPFGSYTGGVLHIRDSSNTLVNLTAYTLRAQIRSQPGSGTPVASITVTKANQATDPGGFTLTMSATTTAAIAGGAYFWDLELTDGSGNVSTWLRGNVTVTEDYTR